MRRKLSDLEHEMRAIARGERKASPLSVEQTPPTELLAALAVPGNQRLLRLIKERQPRTVSDLADMVGRAQPNVTRSLQALERCGLIRLVREGGVTRPELVRERVNISVPDGVELSDATVSSAGAAKAAPAEPSGAPDGRRISIRWPSTGAGKTAPQWATLGRFSMSIAQRPACLQVALGPKSHIDRTEVDVLLYRLTEWVVRRWWSILYGRWRYIDLRDHGSDNPFPSIRFRASGPNVEVACEPISYPSTAFPTKVHETIPLSEAKRMLRDELIRPVLARLDEKKITNTFLQAWWSAIEKSEQDATQRSFCVAAGALGLDPYQSTEKEIALIERVTELFQDEEARTEFLSVETPETVNRELQWIAGEEAARRETNRFAELPDIRKAVRSAVPGAEAVRASFQFAPDRPIGGVHELVRLFGAPKFTAGEPPDEGDETVIRALVSRANEEGKTSGPTIVSRAEGARSLPFLVARGIGDFLLFESRRAPITAAYTWRQAAGRAFAAELLAPSDAVIGMIDEEGRSAEEVARHFGAVKLVVDHQYRNHSKKFRSGAGSRNWESWEDPNDSQRHVRGEASIG